MSNKKYRNPPEQEQAPPKEAEEPAGDNDEADDTEVPYPPGSAKEGMGDIPIDVLEARRMLTRSARFLDTLEEIGIRVLHSVRVDDVRNVVAEEMPLAEGYKESGWKEPKPEPERSDHRKRPRGRKHPLLGLIMGVLQASKVKAQILKVLHPDMHDLFSQSSLKRVLWQKYGVGTPPKEKDPLPLKGL